MKFHTLPLLLLVLMLAACQSVEDQLEADARSKFVGGWHHAPEAADDVADEDYEGERQSLGAWLELRPDGTWTRMHDHDGMLGTTKGHWEAEGNKAWLTDDLWNDRFYRRLGEELVLVREGRDGFQTRWQRSATIPEALAALPRLPKTIDEAVTVIREWLPEEEEAKLASMPKDELISLHFGFGMGIRNSLGLWGSNPELLEACGSADMHPDTASGIIIEAVWEAVRREREDYQELLKLEEVLETPIRPFPVRGMPLKAFISELNEVTNATLDTGDHPLSEVTLVHVEEGPDAAWVRDMRLKHFPALKVWAMDREAAEAIPLRALLHFANIQLKPPSTVEISVRSWGAFGKEGTIEWHEVDWKGDTFDLQIESSNGQFFRNTRGDSQREFTWEMAGIQPPMDLTAAARLYVEYAPPNSNESLDELSVSKNGWEGNVVYISAQTWDILDSPIKTTPTIWHYSATAVAGRSENADRSFSAKGEISIKDGPDRVANLTIAQLADEHRWTDIGAGPALTAVEAVNVLNDYLAAELDTQLEDQDMRITLRRAGLTDYWFYEIEVGGRDVDPFHRLTALVLLDGRLVPYRREAAQDDLP